VLVCLLLLSLFNSIFIVFLRFNQKNLLVRTLMGRCHGPSRNRMRVRVQPTMLTSMCNVTSSWRFQQQAEVFFDAPEEYANIAVAAVDCASPSGVGVCKWLNVLNYPGYLIFTGEDRRFYQYLEHHWTEFGDGDELVSKHTHARTHTHTLNSLFFFFFPSPSAFFLATPPASLAVHAIVLTWILCFCRAGHHGIQSIYL